MNLLFSQAFGVPPESLPLKKSSTIRHGNALRLDWNDVLPAKECSYILGNPPFIGHHLQSEEQKAEQHAIWPDISAAGVLDYVTSGLFDPCHDP